MFWILNSVNFACENTTKPVLFKQKNYWAIIKSGNLFNTCMPNGPLMLWVNLSVIVSFNHKATSVLQVLMWRQQTGDSKLINTPELDPLEFYWLNILWYK